MIRSQLVCREHLHHRSPEAPGGEDFGRSHRSRKNWNTQINTGANNLRQHHGGNDETRPRVQSQLETLHRSDRPGTHIATVTQQISGEADEVGRPGTVQGNLQVNQTLGHHRRNQLLDLSSGKETEDANNGHRTEQRVIEGRAH